MIHCVGKTLAMNVKSNLPHIVSMLRKSDTNIMMHVLYISYTIFVGGEKLSTGNLSLCRKVGYWSNWLQTSMYVSISGMCSYCTSNVQVK